MLISCTQAILAGSDIALNHKMNSTMFVLLCSLTTYIKPLGISWGGPRMHKLVVLRKIGREKKIWFSLICYHLKTLRYVQSGAVITRFHMMTLSNGNLSALLNLCAGKFPVNGEFPRQRSLTRSFDVFFDLRLNKRLSKQSGGWCFQTLARPLWHHCIDRIGYPIQCCSDWSST